MIKIISIYAYNWNIFQNNCYDLISYNTNIHQLKSNGILNINIVNFYSV